MNKHSTLLFSMLAAAALVMAGCSTNRISEAPRISTAEGAVIRAVTGSAEVANSTGAWTPARVGDVLAEGARARTGVDASIDFELQPIGGVLTLTPGSFLEFERIGSTRGDPEVAAILNLVEGRVTGDTLVLPPNTKVVLKTPSGIHEIR